MDRNISLEQEIAESNAQVVARVMDRDVTRGELKVAFDRVADPRNWKNPIDSIVEVDEFERLCIAEAIVFFAGCKASFRRTIGNRSPFKNCYRVRAVGYYAAVGA